MKSLSKTLLVLYLLLLLWLVLFKFSFDFASVVLGHQTRGLNLIPFADFSRSNVREMLDNVVVFIPFGLLLSVNFKKTTFRQKLSMIFIFSVAVEVIQYILAIGVSDITDVIMNTLGGLCGLVGYALVTKYSDTEKLDRFVIIIGTFIIIVFLVLRIFVFKVRY